MTGSRVQNHDMKVDQSKEVYCMRLASFTLGSLIRRFHQKLDDFSCGRFDYWSNFQRIVTLLALQDSQLAALSGQLIHPSSNSGTQDRLLAAVDRTRTNDQSICCQEKNRCPKKTNALHGTSPNESNPLSWSVEQESKRYKLWIFIRKVEAIHGQKLENP